MTEKDYKLIAGALLDAVLKAKGCSAQHKEGVDIAVDVIAAALQRDNVRFDKVKFYKAIGYTLVSRVRYA